MPVDGKQWLLNVFDAWIIQKIRSKTLHLFFSNDFLHRLA